jgi:hypothetical protein
MLIIVVPFKSIYYLICTIVNNLYYNMEVGFMKSFFFIQYFEV